MSAHDISDLTQSEKADLFAHLIAYFGAAKHLFQIAKGVELCQSDTALIGSSRAMNKRLDDFMTGYLAGVADTDKQNEEDQYMSELEDSAHD